MAAANVRARGHGQTLAKLGELTQSGGMGMGNPDPAP